VGIRTAFANIKMCGVIVGWHFIVIGRHWKLCRV